MAITSPADKIALATFGAARSPIVVYFYDCCFDSGAKRWIEIPSTVTYWCKVFRGLRVNIVKCSNKMLFRVRSWSALYSSNLSCAYAFHMLFFVEDILHSVSFVARTAGKLGHFHSPVSRHDTVNLFSRNVLHLRCMYTAIRHYVLFFLEKGDA